MSVGHLLRSSREATIQLVREFYANLLEHDNGIVMVRNTPDNGTLNVICRVYRLSVFRAVDDTYCTFSSSWALWGTLLDIICVPEGESLWITPRILTHTV